jgi:hypothetical protein
MLGVARLLFRTEPYDVVKMLAYRPELLGKPLNRISQAVMRGKSHWTVGERELFATFVSQKNHCLF